jgi:NAD(P)H dehydrogenase (quinone)
MRAAGPTASVVCGNVAGAGRSYRRCPARQKRKATTMAQSTRFLIVGAGGRVGATGYHATRQLIEKGLPVRAFVRRADERAAELETLGADVAVGNLRNFDDVSAALDGVQRAYFTFPVADGLVEATTIFAAAGQQAGLESVVNMSQITARPDHPSPASRQHWLAERVFDWSGIGVTHIRPTFFLENLIGFAARTIQAEGKIYLPYGQGRHAPVAGQDLARVVVGLLSDPETHRGKTYVPTGPESMSLSEMATVFARVLGRTVEYVDIPVERWRQMLSNLAGMSPHFIEHLARVAEAHQRGEFDAVTDVVERVGGEPPISLEAFIQENAAAFGSVGADDARKSPQSVRTEWLATGQARSAGRKPTP